jgi:hypothetical protein
LTRFEVPVDPPQFLPELYRASVFILPQKGARNGVDSVEAAPRHLKRLIRLQACPMQGIERK